MSKNIRFVVNSNDVFLEGSSTTVAESLSYNVYNWDWDMIIRCRRDFLIPFIKTSNDEIEEYKEELTGTLFYVEDDKLVSENSHIWFEIEKIDCLQNKQRELIEQYNQTNTLRNALRKTYRRNEKACKRAKRQNIKVLSK